MLATTELDWQDFFQATPDLFCILGSDGCFLELNLAWSTQMGWTSDELLLQPFVKFLHPEDANSLAAISSGQEVCFENRYLHKNGTYRWLSWRVSSQRQGLVYATARDITEDREELDALKLERESLYNLLDQLPTFLYIQPRDYGVGFYNQRFKEVFGEPQGRRTYQIYDYLFKDMNGEEQVVEMGLDITAVKQAELEVRKTSAELALKNTQLETSLNELKLTQGQLIQTEKMSSLGQLVAGVAHEINNPVNFIYGNLVHAGEYIEKLLDLVDFYQAYLPPNRLPEIQEYWEEIEFEFMKTDLPKLLASMKLGTKRIQDIVRSLRTFSRLDEAEMKVVDIHEGIDSALMILGHRCTGNSERNVIQVIKEYGNLPQVDCYAGQLNQVFLNIITNAIDALEERMKQADLEDELWQPTIAIGTQLKQEGWVEVRIRDNGIGMGEAVQQQLFNPFFTTKSIGKGTGLGMSISYQIVTQKHGGKLEFSSTMGEGTEFVVEIPIQQPEY